MFHSQTNASKGWWTWWPRTAEYLFHRLQHMCRTCTGSQGCQTRWARAAELHAQEMLPVIPSHGQSCCSRDLPVPKRPGLHVESSDFMWTQFLVTFYQLPGPWKHGTAKLNWYILVLLLFELPLLLSSMTKPIYIPKDIKPSALTLNTKVSPLLMSQDFTGAFKLQHSPILFPTPTSNCVLKLMFSPQTTGTILRAHATFPS